MVFSSTVFLFIFLPMTCLLYLLLQRWAGNLLLVVASLLFYTWGEPVNVMALLVVCLLSYIGGMLLRKYDEQRQLIVYCVVVMELALLAVYKYTDFIITSLNEFLGVGMALPHIALPIGISFFTFQAISYILDVYKGESSPQENPVKMVLYISFFPQLIAGPIVKYHEVKQYLDNPDLSLQNVIYGLQRFIVGLGKKVLLANTLGQIADQVFSSGDTIATSAAWLGAICYTLQIYFDFSGYSDMAIGLGRIFGFHFKENFNHPYISLSITEFWRRWHISLGTWFKEYLYIPLGGNRKGNRRTCFNLMFVFFITGLWHGAGWTFILWGCWHGVFVLLERQLGVKQWGDSHRLIRHIYVMLVFVIGWIFFRATSLTEAVSFLQVLFSFDESAMRTWWYFISPKLALVLTAGIMLSTTLPVRLTETALSGLTELQRTFFQQLGCAVIYIVSLIYLSASTYNPFIYFRF